ERTPEQHTSPFSLGCCAKSSGKPPRPGAHHSVPTTPHEPGGSPARFSATTVGVHRHQKPVFLKKTGWLMGRNWCSWSGALRRRFRRVGQRSATHHARPFAVGRAALTHPTKIRIPSCTDLAP